MSDFKNTVGAIVYLLIIIFAVIVIYDKDVKIAHLEELMELHAEELELADELTLALTLDCLMQISGEIK